MSEEQDRRNRDLELLRGAVERDRERGAKPEPEGRSKKKSTRGSSGMMYRGQPVAGRNGGRAPGAPGSGGGPRRSAAPASESSDIKAALRKLTALFNDGLISKAEYDAKRSEILDRL